VVACLGTVATSPPLSAPVTSEYTGPTLRLTQETPRLTRRLIVRATARDSDAFIEGGVNGELVARWKPAGASATPAPKLSAALERVDVPTRYPWTVDFTAPDTDHPTQAGSAYFHSCNLKDGCEMEVELEVMALGDLGTGTIEVDWRLLAEIQARTDDTPKGFAVSIEEP
jgi:hypothetical protein